MKRANGDGSVYKVKRKSGEVWLAVVTPPAGSKKQVKVGQFSSRDEAEIALNNFNAKPYDIKQNNLTVKELYEVFIAEKSKDTRLSLLNQFRSAYNYFAPIANKKFKNIEAIDIINIINNCPKSAATKATIKNLHKHLESFARIIGMKIIPVNDLVTFKAVKSEHKKSVFKSEDVAKLRECGEDWADSVLILLYSGIRMGELLTIQTKNIDLKNRIMVGGIKTEAGINRKIPIHKSVLPLIENKILKSKNGFLFELFESNDEIQIAKNIGTIEQEKLLKSLERRYLKKWNLLFDNLQIKGFTPHCTRHSFVTKMLELGVPEYKIKKIIGHSTGSVTTDVYFSFSAEEMLKTVDLLEY
jgi:integrase